MIKTILADDEKPSLRELKFLLEKYKEISIVGVYSNPLKAIEAIGQIKPDAVFLDINMPQLQGIDAASRILDMNPETDIVFVTAYDEYAIEAFELHALDYILKPVNPERLKKTIDRLKNSKSSSTKSGEKVLSIKCLGQFSVGWINEEPIKWRTEKTREIFAYLLHNEGRDISKEELLDSLWPEDDTEKAIRQLYNGIYYIRKALERYGVERSLVRISSSYNLQLGPVDYDVKAFHNFEKGNGFGSIEELEALEALYTGDYLEGEYYNWSGIESDRLSNLYIQCLIKLSKKFMEKEQWDRAETYLMKAYNKNPYEEKITELLLMLYINAENKSKAVVHFRGYSDLIRKELGIEPNIKLQELMQSLR